MKQNCWDFNDCGQGPGGAKITEKGLCKAASDTTHAGTNEGQNAGRYCWHVTDCTNMCDFRKSVELQEGKTFTA